MDNKDKSGKIERIDPSKGFLALPFDEEQFKEFLIGLLGKPQKIERVIRGAFEIHLSDIQNFHYLIEQRINQQNAGKLLQFRAKVLFDDESSVELNSFVELETYNEIRPIISTGIELSWDYLILFQDKKIPEKQTINININSGNEDNGRSIGPYEYHEEGFFRIEIYHTARTWAADMEAILTNHINSLMKTPDKLRAFIEEKEGSISMLTGVLFSLMAVTGSFWATKNFLNRQLSSIGNLITNEMDIGRKIDLLAAHIASGATAQHYFGIIVFLVFSLFLAILFSIWVSSNIVSPRHSFIILTRKALEEKEEILDRDERKWRGLLFSFIISIITGVISNYVFLILAR